MMKRSVWIFTVVTCFLFLLEWGDCVEELGGSGETPSSSPQQQQQNLIIPLKHRRYKSIRDNTTTSSSTSSSSTNNLIHTIIPEDIKSPRHGPHHHSHPFELQKTPPDLQFGLAFTVPFISLSTDKLLNTVTGKGVNGGGGGWDPYSSPVSSLLKLNFGGLLLAAIVGVIGIAGLLLPGLFNTLGNNHHGGGWGGNVLDNLFPASFTDSLYNDYNNGWDKSGGTGWAKEWDKRDGRKTTPSASISIMENLYKGFKTITNRAAFVEKCVAKRICKEEESSKKSKNNPKGGITAIAKELENKTQVFGKMFKNVKKVLDGGAEYCGDYLGLGDDCDGVEEVGGIFSEMFFKEN